MKTILTLAFLAAALAAPVACADDAHHVGGTPQAGEASRTAPASRVNDETMKQMRDHMVRMREFMTKMEKTTDPAERQKLTDEHMKTMQDGMAMMCGMSGGMMQGMIGGNMMQQHHHPQNAGPG